MADCFESVLIANRGEIAVRIIRACRQAGLRSVAVYSEADASALHVRLADEAYRIGPAPAAESYLSAPAILTAARQSGAQAIHPGYGFLAEDAAFAELCQQAGLVWIGPPPAAMRLLGDKSAAKALAERLGVPTLPGYHGEAQDDASLRAAADRIGYPLLVKAAAGGGGRGMRLVSTPKQLREALASARREAQAAFGSDLLLLERYLRQPRHVEMQIFGDQHGRVVHLGERDCSAQRRHQKVVEEAPAPNFSTEQRQDMGGAAVKLADAAGYTSAGTVEFLLDDTGRFYFLEANTRLQVEHPVTELVTGLDLVRLQFQVAAGHPLPMSQAGISLHGHAIEARLYAEDPSTGFLPSSGRLTRLDLPVDLSGVRVDTGVCLSDEVSPFYDPLLAKIIVHGEDRQAAVDRLAEALAGVAVRGVRTNLEFLQAIVETPAFAEGRVNTQFVEEHHIALAASRPDDDLLIAAAASEVLAVAQSAASPGDPWRQAGPWRVGWVGARVCYRFAGRSFPVAFRPPLVPGEPWRFELPSGPVERRIRPAGPDAVLLERDGSFERIEVSRRDDERLVRQGRRAARLQLVSELDLDSAREAAEARTGHDVVRAPMPGRIARLAVKPGDRVKLNQTLVVLDAMKIEHLVGAPRDGVVEQLRYKEGDQVERGAILVDLEDL